MLLFSCLVGLASTGGCFSSRVIVAGEDRICLPNRPVLVSARVEERAMFLKDIEHQPFFFELTGEPGRITMPPLLQSETNGGGEASVEFVFPSEGLYEITARYPGSKRHRPGQDMVYVRVIKPGVPVLVLDIDNTLTNETWLHRDPEPEPYDADTVRVVRELSCRYVIIYLSSRHKALHRRTRVWLAKYGFPDGPILLWYPEKIGDFNVSKYKRNQLEMLREMQINLAVGVTNTKADIRAYRRAGIITVFIIGKDKTADGAVSVRGWKDIALSLEHRDH